MIKFLHTRVRVSDLETTIAFYAKLGFECTRRTDKSPAGNQLAFLELEGNEHFLELCYSPDFEVKFPEDLVHTAVGVEDIVSYCDELAISKNRVTSALSHERSIRSLAGQGPLSATSGHPYRQTCRRRNRY